MTNKEKQKWLDKRKWKASEETGRDMSGHMDYCAYCVNRKGLNGCKANQTEREQGYFCATAYNLLIKRNRQKSIKESPKSNIRELVCIICGKTFIPAPMHIYKVKGKLVCSYNCRCAFEKSEEQKKAAKRRGQ